MTDYDLTLTRPLIFLPVLVAAVAVVVGATFLMIPAPEAAAAIAAPVGPSLLVRATSGRERACATCGVMTSIRRTDPATGEPVYAFSVRMRDGSIRDSTESSRGGWLEGDRVVVIGGAAARSLEQKRHVSL